MKKIGFSAVLILMLVALGAQTKIQLADNQRVMQMGILNDGSFVFLIKEENPGYISIIENSFLLTQNKKIKAMNMGLLHFYNKGTNFVYSGYEENGISLITANGRSKKGPYDDIGLIAFGNMSDTLAFVAQIDNKNYVIDGNTRIGPYKDIGSMVYGQNDKLVYAAQINDDWFIIMGTERVGPFEAISDIKYFPDNNSLVYSGKKNGNWFISKDGTELGPFTEVGDFTYSPDGKTFTYAVSINWTWNIIRGNASIGQFNKIGSVSVSPDGKNIAYTEEKNGQWYLSVNDEIAGPYARMGSELIFSPDNKTIAYSVKIDEKWYVINGVEKIGPYEAVENLRFSDNGKVLAFYALDETGVNTKLVINSAIFSGFIVNGKAAYIDNGILYQ